MTNITYNIDPSCLAIRESGKNIYEKLDSNNSNLWLSSKTLEKILNEKLCGLDLNGLPLRTRSKVVKEQVCKALGYPVPNSFKKTQPRFVGQNFDTYVQKSNNLQIWNEELDASRRYVLLKVSDDSIVERVKVVDGSVLAKLDTTGTLTHKYQARFENLGQPCELISAQDTDLISEILLDEKIPQKPEGSPVSHPEKNQFIPIGQLYEELCPLVGLGFPDAGHDQERNRGAELHRIICQKLGYITFQDDGAFPDITAQLLEVKLQTSPTIDLGLVIPNSNSYLDIPPIEERHLRHCDVRYAVFYGDTDGEQVKLTNFVLTTGRDFFSRFPRFEGNIKNKKLQIPLPKGFFDS